MSSTAFSLRLSSVCLLSTTALPINFSQLARAPMLVSTRGHIHSVMPGEGRLRTPHSHHPSRYVIAELISHFSLGVSLATFSTKRNHFTCEDQSQSLSCSHLPPRDSFRTTVHPAHTYPMNSSATTNVVYIRSPQPSEQRSYHT